MEMEVKLAIYYRKEFGYCVRRCILWEDVQYTAITDMQWIRFLGIPKDFYIDTLINEYHAYQNASREFPKLFFKRKEDAERALTDFYEPLIIAMKLHTNQF